jgi:phage terminase large subunit GpA-like protein
LRYGKLLSPQAHLIRTRALASLVPPPKLALSTWIERELRLPEGVSALPGAVRLWPYQRGIADAISDSEIARVTLVGMRSKLWRMKPACISDLK